jgi:hypothetical protein
MTPSSIWVRVRRRGLTLWHRSSGLPRRAHIRNVPSRKTDLADAAWIAQLVERGLVHPSFVLPPPSPGAVVAGAHDPEVLAALAKTSSGLSRRRCGRC